MGEDKNAYKTSAGNIREKQFRKQTREKTIRCDEDVEFGLN
jgi:hypothetical protein